MGSLMKIQFLSEERKAAMTNGKKHVLIGKLWFEKNRWCIADGRIGTKPREANVWDFSHVILHPQDHLYLVENSFKKGLRDPDLLLYVEIGVSFC